MRATAKCTRGSAASASRAAPTVMTWPAASTSATTRTVASYLGFRVGPDGRLRMRWHVAEVFGENALAVYLLSDSLGDNIGAMLPDPCPNWYFLIWGEGLYFIVAYIATSYLRAHKLFLRL